MTDQEIINRAEIILNEEEEILIPVLKLYDLIADEIENFDIDSDHFISLLQQDDRFQVLDSQSTMEPWTDDDDDEMLALGYYKGPRVILKNKIPTKEEMMQTVTEKMQNTIRALKSAYKVNPDSLDDEQEEEFLQILKKVKDLQKKLDDQNKNEE